MNDTLPLADRLLRLGVLPDEAQGEVARLRRRGPDDRALVAGLVLAGHLTPFQASQALRGRAHHLAVGPYVLLDRVGRGGMGQVFRARHRHLGRVAAVKLTRLDRHGCPDAQRRFLREARLSARMNHPHVIHALDAGAVRGTHFLALEFVPGPDLGRVVRADGPLAVGVACEYARQAALGLAHVHSRGVVHRDVKPANLGLAGGERVVKVLDLGLATGRPRPEEAGKAVGSPDYAAPEQTADPCRLTPQSDVYGLGASLYYLLSGRVPYPGGTAVEKVIRHHRDVPRPVEEYRPGLPAGVRDLVPRLMARHPRARPCMAEAAEELGRFATPVTEPVWAAVATPTADIDLPTLSGGA